MDAWQSAMGNGMQYASLPKYIEDRIRRPIPNGCFVVPGSTPVVSFGDCTAATIATFGLNPSCREFLADDGSELIDVERRFETMRSLGVSRLDNADEAVVRKVFDGCRNYFLRRPHRRWFDRLKPVLDAAGASFYDGSACHLDLVQWATDPVWRELDRKAVRARMLEADVPFLLDQLRGGRIRLLLLNGRGVIRAFEDAAAVHLDSIARLSGPAQGPATVVQGTFEKVLVIGWTVNLQSSMGVTRDLPVELGTVIAAAISKSGPFKWLAGSDTVQSHYSDALPDSGSEVIDPERRRANMHRIVESVPLSFDARAHEGTWFRWADVEACFWPGRGGRAEKVNPKLAPVRYCGGVYLLAWSPIPPERLHPATAEVKYIGQTNNFRGRMGQFATSAGFWGQRANGHSAGWRWPEGQTRDTWIAFFEVGESLRPHLAAGLRCWMEGLALEEHRLKLGRLPEINEAVEAIEFGSAGGDGSPVS